MNVTEIIITIVGTVAGTLGGKEAWAYYKHRLEIKKSIIEREEAEEAETRDEIREMLENQITELKEQIRLLTGRIKHLEEERESDKKRIANQEIRIALLNERLKGGGQDIPTIE